MYTQCPECLTAFRVTEGLLQQASGRVRCGSCSHAFNALEHLSEEPPPAEASAGESAVGEEEQDALLDTFTDLSAFDDIRIEDTGVEWRVVDDEEPADDQLDNDSTGSSRWFMTGEEDRSTAGDVGVPEVHDEVPPEERLREGDDSGGILVEESGIREPEPPEERQVELRYDDNTPLPDDVEEIARPSEPEAPRRRATDAIEPRSPEFDERQSDLELGAPEDWRELLDEFGREPEAGTAPPAARPGGPPPAEAADVPADIDTQFDLQALEMGIDVTGSRVALPDGAAAARPEEAPAEDTAEEAVELELEADTDVPPDRIDFDPGATAAHRVDLDLHVEAETPREPLDFDPGPTGAQAAGEEPDFALAEAFETAGADEDRREQREREAALEAELDAAFAAEGPSPPEPEVPPQTEEEMTINMQIDQDLLRLAAEDGFSSTLTGERRMPEDLLVETIVMEGDFVRSALDKELDAVAEKVGADDDPRLLLDTYIKSKEEHVRGGRRRTDPPSYAVISGVVVLGLVLVGQVVHAYRESLATYGAFDHTVGSVYRLLGEPLVPQWDVRGWRFEATSGSTDAADEILTIRSRISNQSGSDLPYPLLHVALTDRFEEVIGSRVLEPADYLAEGVATAQAVAAGEEFSATITVESVSAEATGFKLNVCYRQDAARLRCATEDFRN